MKSGQKKRYAKAVLLGQRIYLNSQAMMSQISRSFSGGDSMFDRNKKEKVRKSLNDLGSCLKEFQEITEIELADAQEALTMCLEDLKREDFPTLYERLQKLYRDDYLGKIVELSK
jgi:hypothetical protein